MIEPLDVLFAQGFVPLLHSLDAILEKAATYAEEKRLDLVNARLAPDMFTLAQQIQIATYFARETPSRLMGREAAFDIGEAATTIEGMRKQVADIGLDLEACHVDPRHQPVDDDAGWCEGGE